MCVLLQSVCSPPAPFLLRASLVFLYCITVEEAISSLNKLTRKKSAEEQFPFQIARSFPFQEQCGLAIKKE